MDNGTLFNLLLFAVFLMPWFIGTGPQLLELKPHQPRQDLDAMLQARERNRALKKAVATIVSNDDMVCGALAIAQQINTQKISISDNDSSAHNTGTLGWTKADLVTIVSEDVSEEAIALLMAAGYRVSVKEIPAFPQEWSYAKLKEQAAAVRVAAQNENEDEDVAFQRYNLTRPAALHAFLGMKYAFLPVELWGYYEDYDRIVYLAPNVLPTTNVDLELMFSTTGDKPVAAVTGIESHLTIFDSSLMVLSPDKEVYEELLRSVADIGNTYGTMMSFIKDTVDSSVLNILAIPEESDVYTGLLTMVFLNRAFPDWHDLDGTGRHHSTGATLLSSHAAELRVDSWMRNQPSSFKEDAAIVSLVDSTQFVQFQGYAPWSCSSRCAAKGWHCGFNKNGVFKDSVQEYLYRGTKPMFSKIFWLTLADASTESQQWCSNRVDTVLCYVMESDEYMQPYRPAQ